MQNCIQPIAVIHNGKKNIVPCGKCIYCINSKRMNWLMRIEQEQKYNLDKNEWFLTLTYNEKKVPRKKGVRTLYKRHPQLFFKRLRKAGYNVKYILVGEYGSKTQRPHYHAIIWTDANADAIDKAWNYGHVHYRKVAKESILYTLKYIMLPRQGDNEHKQREYAVFSKGLGLSYLTENMYYYHNPEDGEPRFTTVIENRVIPLPRYYRDKIFTKYQRAVHANKMYYVALKEKLRRVRELVKQGYKSGFKAYKELNKLHAQKLQKRNKQYSQKQTL